MVWHIRNGTIDSVGNESQGWSRAVIDYPVPYEEDLTRIRTLMEQAANSLYRERGWKKLMLEKPEVWGAQGLSGREVTMRLVAKTVPMRQLEVGRELRARVKATLDEGRGPAGRAGHHRDLRAARDRVRGETGAGTRGGDRGRARGRRGGKRGSWYPVSWHA